MKNIRFYIYLLNGILASFLLVLHGCAPVPDDGGSSTPAIEESPAADPCAATENPWHEDPTRADPRNAHSPGRIDDMLDRLEWGNIIANTPQSMQIEEPNAIELLLSPSKSIPELQSEVEQIKDIESAKIKISNRMRASLSGQAFRVQPLVPEEQAVSSIDTTRWAWEVIPTLEGKQQLYLSLSVVIRLTDQRDTTEYLIRTFNREIDVEISFGKRVSNFWDGNWQWLWAVIFAPVATFLWQRYRKKKS